MAEASEKMQRHTFARQKQSGTRTLTLEEMREHNDFSIRCRISYMQFIERVNRTGRVLKKWGFSLPSYGRIYFFSNKMVEHWDDYLQFLSNGQGLLSYGDKIAISHDLAGISLADNGRRSLQQTLTDEFAKCGVALPSLEGKWYGDYADIMYGSLEKIDSELRTFEKKRKIGIPEPLVTALFKYCFPTPICDMEEYYKILVAWLATLPL